MAAELVTPTDVVSGLPYVIIPEGDGRPAPGSFMTKHHANHPGYLFRRENPETLEDYAAIAWRLGRIQDVDALLHNTGRRSYHRFYKGPGDTPPVDKVFQGLVMSCAGYVPAWGIDLRSGEPIERQTTPTETAQLRATQGLGMRYFSYSYEDTRNFMQRYAVERGVGHVAASFLREFIDPATTQERRWHLGHSILAQAAQEVSAGVRKPYKHARDAGLLHPLTPPAPHALVRYKMGNSKKRAKLFPLLQRYVSTQLAV